jgi:hypothetical protein
MTDTRVERDLRLLAAELDAGVARMDVSEIVAARLNAGERRTFRVRRLVAVAIVLAVTVVAVPPARGAVARVWRFGADRIHVGDAPSHPSGASLPNLGTRVTVDEAAQRFPVVVPGGRFARPDSTWFDARAGGQVSLVYGEGEQVRLLVQEYPGDGRIMVDKYIKYEDQAEAVHGDGFRGVFIHGPPHTVVYE